MLQLSAMLLGKPVLSLRTGRPVAIVRHPLFNPNNLKLEGLFCEDNLNHKELILLYQDIREFTPRGYVVDDHDVLAEAEDLVRLKDLIDLNFELLGKQVETVSKHKLGKVTDYAVEIETMFVQKFYVSQPLFKNFTGGTLSVDRSQIVEITNRRIIINDPLDEGRVPVTATA